MTVVWTPELKAKAAATRAETKRLKQERAQKRAEKQAEIVAEDSKLGNDVPLDGYYSDDSKNTLAKVLPPVTEEIALHEIYAEPKPFDWEKAPIPEILNKQADLKREYERISQIVLRRQNPEGKKWMCFSEEVRREKGDKVIPKAVLAACQKFGDDGKWKFRDDGRFVIVDGVRTLRPAFCCNSACFSFYQMSRGTRSV